MGRKRMVMLIIIEKTSRLAENISFTEFGYHTAKFEHCTDKNGLYYIANGFGYASVVFIVYFKQLLWYVEFVKESLNRDWYLAWFSPDIMFKF